MDILKLVGLMIWLMLPAYLANPAASIVIHLTGQGKPVDFGKTMNGVRILGDGKTFKGLFSGIIFGILVALLQNYINTIFLDKSLPYFNFIAVLTLPIGALFGDLIASFFKRRLKFERGQSFPLLDQLDFVFGALILTYFLNSVWFSNNFSFKIILTTIILTPIFHFLTNLAGYKLNISPKPW